MRVLPRLLASPAGDPWWHVWTRQPEERPRSRWRGKWADNGASSWGLSRGLGFSSGPQSLTEKCRCEGPGQWKQFSCPPPPPPPPCSIFRLRCLSVDPVRLPFSFFFFLFFGSLLGGMSYICLVGRPWRGFGRGMWIGINRAEIRKTSPWVQGCAA